MGGRVQDSTFGGIRRVLKRAAAHLLAVFLIGVPAPAAAAPIIETWGLDLGIFIPGQEVTTPAGGPWNQLAFNWYTPCGTYCIVPLALGDLYLLDQPYTGTPAGLSSSVAGYISNTSTIANNQYIFAPGVTIQPNVSYFFYTKIGSPFAVALYTQCVGVGCPDFAFAGASSVAFSLGKGRLDYLLEGTPVTVFSSTQSAAAVPEPGGLVLLGSALLIAARRFARRKPAPDRQ
jgi:hypothetical protein